MDLIVRCLTEEFGRVRTFFTSELGTYSFPPADIAPLRAYGARLQAILGRDIGIPVELGARQVLTPHWKSIFEADNYIDSNRTPAEQAELLRRTIASVREEGRLPTEFPDADHLQRELVDDPLKRHLLLEELEAELRLTNPTCAWLDAWEDRTRVMYYSVLLAVDVAAVQQWSERVRAIVYDGQDLDLEPVCSARECQAILATLTEWIPPHSPTVEDMLGALARISVAVSLTDDAMDLEEDRANEKYTGVTQALREGVTIEEVRTTCLAYLQAHATTSVERWLCEAMVYAYQEETECIESCRSISPYLFQYFFQRK
jgi:hypothetical protein